ncbi:hypothetical protein [Paenibacillus sp. J2TS4]|uniref:hypothetical protein n=1 Tax=Paenibacillus sp. J2TS4 TaxID=2807194 RepID=UPI001B236B9E|nr:hypothetical protein [Paenibacillus sp. J2TS4]GIP32279.1 hypothetical protein J2TS4_14890 [Paenibacillus sp. J2TS4]
MKYSLKHSMKWSIFISVVTFIMAGIFTVASTSILEGVSWGFGMLIVFLLVLIGVFFDILGLAAAAASEVPFHGMASERVKGSKHSIYIVRNADRFSNFCNDVIGDMAGVISGAASAIVVIKLLGNIGSESQALSITISVIFTAMVSAMTVGGKALGKSFAIHYATDIVLMIGKLFYYLERHLKIRLFNPKKRKRKSLNGKRGNKRARTSQSA